MKIVNFYTLVALITFLSSSCARTLSVFDSEGTRVKGIPFYAHIGVAEQQTKYLYTWKEISLIREEENREMMFQVASARTTDTDKLRELEIKFESLGPKFEKGTENELVTLIRSLNQDKLLESTDIHLEHHIENKWSIKSTVDYSKTYYLNSKIPWFGSASVTQKLAPNGSLTEVSGTTDSQLDEMIGSVVSLATPLSSIKVAKIQAATTSANEETADLTKQEKDSSYTYTLKIEEKGYLYTFYQTHYIDKDGPKRCYKPIGFNTKKHNYTRENWPKPVSDAKTEDNAAIKVSGTIRIPDESKGDKQ